MGLRADAAIHEPASERGSHAWVERKMKAKRGVIGILESRTKNDGEEDFNLVNKLGLGYQIGFIYEMN